MRAFQHLPLRTARLELRPLREADVAALFAIHADPAAMRYWDAPAWKDDARGRAMVARDLALATRDYLRLGIVPADGGLLVGTCALWRIDEQHRRAEIGYLLDPRHWGRGYMREALSALLDYAFADLDLNRVEADTDPRNERSTRLLERLGFAREGHFRERCIVDGELSDSAMYGLLRRDWRPDARPGGAAPGGRANDMPPRPASRAPDTSRWTRGPTAIARSARAVQSASSAAHTSAGPRMASPSLAFSTTDAPPDDAQLAVDAGLDRHNFAVAPLADVRPLAAFASDDAGTVVGGAVGRTWGRCCELLQLWVAPDLRSQGVGSRLLREFEARARSRGCDTFYLTTLSYQAPAFYRKHGYVELARIAGYPDGIVKFLMQRTEA